MLSAVFFRLSTWELWLIIAAIVLGFVAAGYGAGRFLRMRDETLREPVGIVQGAFFALVGLILAFGLTLAIGRYDTRRAAVVDDANTIGTTYLRAQTLAEPMRSRSLQLLKQYTDASIALSHRSRPPAGSDEWSPGRTISSAGSGHWPGTRSRARRETAPHGSTSRHSTR